MPLNILRENLVEKRYGRLKVVRVAPSYPNNKGTRWYCECDCGKEKIIATVSLKSGRSQSCGCLMKEINSKAKFIHGQGSDNCTSEYSCWQQMKDRCNNPQNHAHPNYGGRGISVCERWINSFVNFFEDMGKKPSSKHSLDRYPNKNGNYEPSNCRWATEGEQQRNRRNNKWIEYEGINLLLLDWSKYFNVNQSAVRKHLKTKTFSQVFEYYKSKKSA